jgi:hypothetical protein
MKSLSYLIVLLLVGCEYRQETKQYGVFEYTQFFEKKSLDWEGGNQNIYKEKLCGKGTDLCVEAKHLDFSVPSPESKTLGYSAEQPWLILFKQTGVANKVRFFNAKTGNELFCSNCGIDFENRMGFYGGELLEEHWTDGAKRVLIKSAPKDQSKLRFDYLEFQVDHVEFHPIVEYVTHGNPVVHLRMKERDFFAWMICNDECVANSFYFNTRKLEENLVTCTSGQTIWMEKHTANCVEEDEFLRRRTLEMQTSGQKN